MRLKVFITVDTEVWPRTADALQTKLAGDIRRDIYGDTPGGSYGIGYQMEVLKRYGLKAVFFMEPLFACRTGIEPLRRITGELLEGGHDVQLHIHTEWLNWLERPPVETRARHVGEFSEAEQRILLELAADNLTRAGADRPCAFRAGNYGADNRTLRVLSQLGIPYDSSYNFCYLQSDCGIRAPERLLQPAGLEGITEYPVTFFSDWPGHFRHFELCACSTSELRNVLLSAWRRKWDSVVLVSHGFELLRQRKQPRPWALPNRVAIHRFEWLCRYLGENSDKFETATFAGLPRESAAAPAKPEEIIRSLPLRTAFRYVQQAAARLL